MSGLDSSKPLRISDKLYITQNAVIEFGSSNQNDYVDAAESSRIYGAKGQHVFWGGNDSVLYEMHKLCTQNPNKWRLISVRRDFVVGKGLKILLKTYDNVLKKYNTNDANLQEGEAKNVNDFFKKTSFNKLIKESAMMLEFSGRFYIKITLDLNKKVENLELIDSFYCRPMRLALGETKVSKYIINTAFGTRRYIRANDQIVPAFDPQNPTQYPVSIIDFKEQLPGQFYNPIALWWGTKDWTRVSNKIPMFHEEGLENGYNLKYHVSIPDDYFDGEDLTQAEINDKKDEVCRIIDKTLRGKKDTVLFTFHRVDINGKEITGVKVTELNNKMSDNAYTLLYKVANEQQLSAHGLLPVQGGIDTGSKMGGSGKELEVAANYTQNFLTFSSRSLLKNLFEMVRLIEGWSDEIIVEFENIMIYNPDVTPTDAGINPNNPNNSDGTNI